MKNLRVNITPPSRLVAPGEPLMALGSCFAEAMSRRLARIGCPGCVNPFGTIYNAHSIAVLTERILENRTYCEPDFVEHQGRWFSFEHATGLWGESAAEAAGLANRALNEAHTFASHATLFLLTYGTSVSFETARNEKSSIVANCHKLPHSLFSKRIMTVEENRDAISRTVEAIRSRRPNAIIVLTLSPVRHTPQDLSENSLSKANLRAALGLVASPDNALNVNYFPAFEIANDEIRDRIHYAADAVHLRPHAVAHIAYRFAKHYFSTDLKSLQRDRAEIQRLARHRHINPDSPAAKAFSQRLAERREGFLQKWGRFSPDMG